MKTTNPKSKKKNKSGLIVAGVATAALVGGAVYLFAGPASAKSDANKGKGRGGPDPGRSGGGKMPGSGRGDAKDGGSEGPGGKVPEGSKGGASKPKGGSSKPKGGEDGAGVRDGVAREGDPKGYWWGDRAKVPEDFDFQSNQIWIAPDRSAAAAGFYFFLDGMNADGERISWDDKGLSFLVADGSILTPTRDLDHREDAVPSLKTILELKDPDTGELALHSVFSWIAAYYGTAIAPAEAASSRAADLLQDMVDEASVLSGGRRAPIDMEGPLRDFYGYAGARLDLGRKAIYGDGWAWGEGGVS